MSSGILALDIEDVVSDLQFLSWVWGSFMENLGVTLSLTSGYHPQSNGQRTKETGKDSFPGLEKSCMPGY